MRQPIDDFVDAMRDRYGAEAVTVALKQARDAELDEEVASRWLDIVARLAQKSAR